MIYKSLLLILTCGLCLAGCDVDKIQRASSDEYVLIKKTELEELRRQAELGRSVGRYREFREGLRTWRIDTATGKTCILLATDWDWKHEAKGQPSCAYEDYQNGESPAK